MKVTYKEHMHDDLFVANTARVSFHKESTLPTEIKDYYNGHRIYEKDARLIHFLAREGHFLPFRHPHISLHIKAPIFVFRQLDKHQVGFSTSETSRRYVDEEPEFFTPMFWRKRAENKKQGSSEEIVEADPILKTRLQDSHGYCLSEYNHMLKEGVAPELARMVLPQSMYTEQIKTGSLLGWSHLYKLRSDEHAQKEIQEIARQIDEIIRPLYPISWESLTNA